MVDGARVGGDVCGVFGRVGAAIHVVSPKVAGSSASLQAGSAVVAERIYPSSVQATDDDLAPVNVSMFTYNLGDKVHVYMRN